MCGQTRQSFAVSPATRTSYSRDGCHQSIRSWVQAIGFSSSGTGLTGMRLDARTMWGAATKAPVAGDECSAVHAPAHRLALALRGLARQARAFRRSMSARMRAWPLVTIQKKAPKPNGSVRTWCLVAASLLMAWSSPWAFWPSSAPPARAWGHQCGQAGMPHASAAAPCTSSMPRATSLAACRRSRSCSPANNLHHRLRAHAQVAGADPVGKPFTAEGENRLGLLVQTNPSNSVVETPANPGVSIVGNSTGIPQKVGRPWRVGAPEFRRRGDGKRRVRRRRQRLPSA
jgi:hypothetical protein